MIHLATLYMLSANALNLFHSKHLLFDRFKALTHSHTMTPFDALGNKPFENTVGKEEIAHNKQFLLFPQCFPPVWITFCHFRQI